MKFQNEALFISKTKKIYYLEDVQQALNILKIFWFSLTGMQ